MDFFLIFADLDSLIEIGFTHHNRLTYPDLIIIVIFKKKRGGRISTVDRSDRLVLIVHRSIPKTNADKEEGGRGE